VNSSGGAASAMPTFLRAMLPKRWMLAIEEHPLLASLLPLVQQSAIYLMGAALVGLGSFVLVPLYTRYLSAEEFGVYALVEISVFMAVTTTQLGLGTTYVRWYAETEAVRRGDLLGSCGAAALVAALAGGGLLVALAGPSGFRWFAALQHLRWMLLPVVVFRNLQGLLFCALQAAQRATAYVTAAVARLLFLSGSGIWFVVLHHRGIAGVLESWLVGDAVCFVVLLGFCVPGQRLRMRLAALRPMLKYGAPLVWSAFMALLLDAAGRFFLANDKSLAEVALYVVGIKITNILSMGFLQPFGSAWAGAAFPIAHRPNAAITYTKIMGYALLVATLLAGMTILFGPLLVRIFAGRAYEGVEKLLPWLLLPVVFRLLEYWSSLPIYLKYKTQWLGPLATAGTALCIVLNYFLVPRLGALGAAIAWSAGLAASIGLMTALGRRYYPLPFDLRTCAFAAGMWALAAAGSRITSSLGLRAGLETSVGSAALLMAACACYFLWDMRASKALFKGNAYAAD